MPDAEYNRLRESSWKRKLTAEEEIQLQAYLATHLESQAEWEDELALTQSLEHLKNVPVPSNFTSLVLQALDREVAAANPRHARPSRVQRWLHVIVPRM